VDLFAPRLGTGDRKCRDYALCRDITMRCDMWFEHRGAVKTTRVICVLPGSSVWACLAVVSFRTEVSEGPQRHPIPGSSCHLAASVHYSLSASRLHPIDKSRSEWEVNTGLRRTRRSLVHPAFEVSSRLETALPIIRSICFQTLEVREHELFAFA
jgi:hypothetical protein